jgi:hypothetical protein
VTRAVPKLLIVAALATLALPASAFASPQQVLDDCSDNDGQLSRDYSNADLRGALDNLPGDIDEYTDCRQVIASAIGAGPGRQGGGSGPAGGAGDGALGGNEQTAQQSDQQALAALTENADGPIEVAGKQVEPGENGVFDLASAENDVPTPLLLVLIALAATAIGGLIFLLRRRVPALARISLPTPKWNSLPRGLGRPRFRR